MSIFDLSRRAKLTPISLEWGELQISSSKSVVSADPARIPMGGIITSKNKKVFISERQIRLHGQFVGHIEARLYGQYPDLDGLWLTTMKQDIPMEDIQALGTPEVLDLYDIPGDASHEYMPDLGIIRFTYKVYDLDLEQYESIFDLDAFIPA